MFVPCEESRQKSYPHPWRGGIRPMKNSRKNASDISDAFFAQIESQKKIISVKKQKHLMSYSQKLKNTLEIVQVSGLA